MRVLFVCIENAGRSQMAEGFAKALAPEGVEIYSAGSRPAAQLNSAAVEAMHERGIDVSGQRPKNFDALPKGTFDITVGMGCGDACPVAKAKRVIFWEIPDPRGKSIEAVRRIRDTIESKVKELLREVTRHES